MKVKCCVSHHFAKGLMIWGWSQMNVGLIQVTSRKSPTNWEKRSLVNFKVKKSYKQHNIWCDVVFIKIAPCQGDGPWFWVEDIQLLSACTGRQRIYASLRDNVKGKCEKLLKHTLNSQSKPELCRKFVIVYLNRHKKKARSNLLRQSSQSFSILPSLS